MSPKKLSEMLRLHVAWLNNDPAGKRAVFRNVNLNKANLSDVNLSRAAFSNVSMSGCSMQSIRLKDAYFDHVNMAYADLRNADLEFATINQTDFSHAELSGANLQYASIEQSSFLYAYMEFANLQFANLPNSDLHGALLTNVNLHDTDLRWLARGNMREIKTATIDQKCIVYTANNLCFGHTSRDTTELFSFDDDSIESIHPEVGVIEWWHKWKPIIQSIIEASPAAPHAGMTTATTKAAQHA